MASNAGSLPARSRSTSRSSLWVARSRGPANRAGASRCLGVISLSMSLRQRPAPVVLRVPVVPRLWLEVVPVPDRVVSFLVLVPERVVAPLSLVVVIVVSRVVSARRPVLVSVPVVARSALVVVLVSSSSSRPLPGPLLSSSSPWLPGPLLLPGTVARGPSEPAPEPGPEFEPGPPEPPADDAHHSGADSRNSAASRIAPARRTADTRYSSSSSGTRPRYAWGAAPMPLVDSFTSIAPRIGSAPLEHEARPGLTLGACRN